MTKDPAIPRKQPSQARAKSTVSRVLDGTRKILKEQGADAISTRNISRVTGISPGSIYQYFGNKEQILFRLYGERLKQSVDAITSISTVDYFALPLPEFWSKMRETLAKEGWGQVIYTELNRAIADNPLLQESVRDILEELYDCLIFIMRNYGSTWSTNDLRHLAEYIFGINHFGYTLRNRQSEQYSGNTVKLTNELEYYLICKAINDLPPSQIV